MNRTRLFLSGGHGDLFPTTKAAAHLTPRWVLAREVPHAPGKGKVYASFTYPGHHNKYQLFTPEMHERKAVPITEAQKGLHYCTTQFPSASAAQAAQAGVAKGMSHKNHKTNDTPIAKANISAKKASEDYAMTRDFRSHLPTPPVKKGFEPHADFYEAESYITKRTASYIKLDNDNKLGWTKEWFPQEVNPPPKPAPPAPKK